MFTRALIACAFAAQLLIVNGDDWAQWRGPMRNGHVPRGESIPQNLPADPKPLWKFNIGNGFASPLISRGIVFYFDNQNEKEVLHAVEAITGKESWRAVIDDTFKDSQGPSGPRCTPLIDDDRAYAQSCKGEFQCLDAKNGKLIWRMNFTNDFKAIFIGEKGQAAGGSRHGNTANPVIDGEHIIVAAGGTDGNSILCFEKRTGKLVWKSQSDQTAYSAPILATIGGTKQVIVFTSVALIGLNPANGDLLWRVPLATSLGRNVTTPVVFEDMVSVGSFTLGLVGVKVTKNAERFAAQSVWTNKAAAMNFSSPVMIGEKIYGLGPSKNLVCVDMHDGRTLWSREGYFNSSADKAYASFIVMNDKLLVLTDAGQLVLLNVSGAEPKEISQTQVCGKNWCNPAYANGILYLRDAKDLLAIDIIHPDN
jgi:outer membrane protein assembly factor BamB